MTTKSFAKSIRVESPCSEDWDKMQGNEKIRFCSHCSFSVNNISAMSMKEAMRLVRRSDGRICIRYHKHPETSAPVFADKLYQMSRRAGIAAGVLGASLAVSTLTYAQGNIRLSKNTDANTETSQNRKSEETKKESPAASISGTVRDSQGAVIPGATISISGTNIQRRVSANDTGEYLLKQVPTEELTITIEAAGFAQKDETVVPAEGRITVVDSTLDMSETFAVGGMMVSIAYENPLHQAVADGELETVTMLLANGADVDGTDKNYEGITALFVAVENGNLEIAQKLLDFGANVNVRDEMKRTPLLALDYNTSPELVRLLIQHGADLFAVDNSGNNVLHVAAENESKEVIEMLLNEGIDLNMQNDEGQTPLMIAVYFENFGTVETLLTAGAKVNIRDKEDATALSIARGEIGEDTEEADQDSDIFRITEILIQYGARE